MPRRNRVLALLAGVTVLSLARLAPATAATVNVSAGDNVFNAATVNLTADDSVVWTNTGARPHTITADDGSFDSGNLTNGQTFTRTFATPGTYRYYCKIHGAAGGIGMSGVIVVAAQVTTTTTAAPATTTTTTTAAPATTDTTAAPTTTVAPQVLSATAARAPAAPALAATGTSATGLLAGLGAFLVVGGVVVVRRARRLPAPSSSPA